MQRTSRVGTEVEKPETVRLQVLTPPSSSNATVPVLSDRANSWTSNFRPLSARFSRASCAATGLGSNNKACLTLSASSSVTNPTLEPTSIRVPSPMRAQEENVARGGNPGIHHGRRRLAIGVGSKLQSVEQSYYNWGLYNPLPDLPAGKHE